MKKFSILCCSIFISLCIVSQNNNYDKIIKIYTSDDICKSLSEIMIHAHTNFEKIRTEEEQPHEDQRDNPDAMKLLSLGYKASLKFPGAKLSSISPGFVGPDSYEAYFGSYKTVAEAEKKLDSLKNQLTTCLKDYKMKKETSAKDADNYSLSYVFDEKRTDNTAPHHLSLILEEDLDWGDDDTPKVFKVYIYIYGLLK